jgi:hypothetical protein
MSESPSIEIERRAREPRQERLSRRLVGLHR